MLDRAVVAALHGLRDRLGDPKCLRERVALVGGQVGHLVEGAREPLEDPPLHLADAVARLAAPREMRGERGVQLVRREGEQIGSGRVGHGRFLNGLCGVLKLAADRRAL